MWGRFTYIDLEDLKEYLRNNNCYIQYSSPKNYKFGNQLGCGAYGIVYEAQDKNTKEKVAIKKLMVCILFC